MRPHLPLAVLLLAASGWCQSPPFSTFNCRPTSDDKRPCERVKYPRARSYVAFYEVEAALREAHSGLSVHIPSPWLRLGELTAEEAPKCTDMAQCAVIENTTSDQGEILRVSVRMREWDLRIFCAAWAEVFEQHYRDRLTKKQMDDALTRAIVNAEYRIDVRALKEEKR